MMYGSGFGFWVMIIGTLIALVVFGGLIWLFVWAIRRTGSGSNNAFQGGAARPQTAREILDQRFARGEITREQYQQMKQDLEG